MIILLSGKSFSGKDTIAKHLPELKRVSIADTMKRCFMKEHPGIDMFDRTQKEAHRLELKEFTHQHPLKYWIKKTPYQDNCIVTDIRTIEEIEYIKEKFNNIRVVRLNASDEIRTRRGWKYKEGYDNTYLETELDDYEFDLVLQNITNDDITHCTREIRTKYLRNNYFVEIGNGYRLTKEPFKGIPFCNPVPLLADYNRRKRIVGAIVSKVNNLNLRPTHILAIESGGYALGAWIADRLKLGFVQARKIGKLPPPTVSEHYAMEYRPDNDMEIQADAFDINYQLGSSCNARVIVVDDIIATGGTIKAGINILKNIGAIPVCVAVFGDLLVNNKSYINTFDIPVVSFMCIDSENKRTINNIK